MPKNRVPAANEDLRLHYPHGGTLKGKRLERAKLAFEEMAQGLGACSFKLTVKLGKKKMVFFFPSLLLISHGVIAPGHSLQYFLCGGKRFSTSYQMDLLSEDMQGT